MATAWGRLPKPVRDTYARIGQSYGLSRSAVRGRFNRQTWDPAREVPRDRRGNPLPYTPPPPSERFVSPMAGPESTLFDNAFDRIRGMYADRDYYNPRAIEDRIAAAGPEAWNGILDADEEDIYYWSSLQSPDEGGPEWLWVETDAGWVNITWYK